VARWLETRFVDGLRFDSVVNIRGIQHNGAYECDDANGAALLERINRQVQASQPWKLTIAEDLQGWNQITAPVASGGMGFSTQWNESLCYALRGAVIPASDAARPMQPIVDALNALSGPNAFKYVVYTENHDKDDPSGGGGRLPDLIHPGQSNSWESKKRSTLAAAVVMTAPAIPMIFEGQEFLAWQPFPNGGAQPAQIDWTMAATFAGITSLYRDMIHLRRNWFNNTRGLQGANLHILPVFADNVLVYHRWDQGGAGDDVVVVCNFANAGYASYAIGLPQGGMWRVRFNSDAAVYDSSFSNWNSFDTMADGTGLNGMPFSGNIGIGPYSCIILSQD
jgi:1,4-alpha-glucan branching enzyme